MLDILNQSYMGTNSKVSYLVKAILIAYGYKEQREFWYAFHPLIDFIWEDHKPSYNDYVKI